MLSERVSLQRRSTNDRIMLLEKKVRASASSHEMRLLRDYLRAQGQAAYKKLLYNGNTELVDVAAELRTIQKILDVISEKDGDSCLVSS